MSGLILGSTIGLPLQSLYPWASTAAKTGNRVVLINMDKNDKVLEMQLRGMGIEVVNVDADMSLSPHNSRFLVQHKYLATCDEEYAVITDVRDVLFQDDPIEWIRNNIKDHDIVCTGEGILYKNEPWGNQNLKDGYPDLYESHKEFPIMNVGVLGGKTKELANLCLEIYEMCKSNKAYLADQSSFNVLCNSELLKDRILKTTSRDSFGLNCGCLIRNCSGGAFVLNNSNVGLLIDPEPSVGKDYRTPTGEKYCIVHQWDRAPKGE